MDQKHFYITTPIYYVNGDPHIGHAYTSIICDVIARSMRLYGSDVIFLSGTDEHGQKVAKAAQNQNKTSQDFVDDMSMKFKNLLDLLKISYDDFIRTTEIRHKNTAALIWNKLKENGDIYLGKYSGWYSMRDETFYMESDLTEEGLAPTGAKVEWIEEPSYFFKLSKYKEQLLEFYDNNTDFIKPLSRYNEVVSFVKDDLRDLSISRTSIGWGIKVPGDELHTIYVWLDALTNYISALGYSQNSDKYSKFWPADLHVIGKDILRFHAVYWPAFLMSAKIPLPKTIFAHGWWTNNGEKMSKSLGNVIDPNDLIAKFGVDPVRYFLIREISLGSDGNYSEHNLVSRNDNELANKIGNLLQRCSAFLHKNLSGIMPNFTKKEIDEIYKEDLLIYVLDIVKKNNELITTYDINSILENIIRISEHANVYIDHQAPWNLKKTNPKRMCQVLYCLLESIRYIGIMLQPFIPDSSNAILDQLKIPNDHRLFAHLSRNYCIEPCSDIGQTFPVFLKLSR